MYADHKIWIGDSEHGDDRGAWECSCGRAGSASIDVIDMAAERHVQPGESVVHTNRPPS